MLLGTFGAILSFGIELENQCAEFYNQACEASSEQIYAKLARGAIKRAKRLERTRREGVAEMILESITGFEGDDYQLDTKTSDNLAALRKTAIANEETVYKFYTDAQAKMPIVEVGRIFQRMAEDNQKNIAELKQ